ncbi:MAG: hypothetical protein V1857_00670 [archaeon]
MTVQIDDAGVGDLLLGAVIGAYRPESDEFSYGMVEVEYFRPPNFRKKGYIGRASDVVLDVLSRIGVKDSEEIQICSSFIFEQALREIGRKYGRERVSVVKIIGSAQRHAETAYLDEIRNIGYEPRDDREMRRARSFFHMLHWIKEDPERIRYAKTGWPRLRRYIHISR